MTIKTWRYYLPESRELRDGWSIVFVDSTGCVAVCSDYGDWCYRWVTRHTGCEDFRDFFVSTTADYVASKFGGGLRVLDGDATRDNIRKDICERRRRQSLARDEARAEWELCDSVVDGELEFQLWRRETELPDSYEMAVHTVESGLKHWTTVSLPRLQAMMREQLAAERGAPDHHAGGAHA
jgi:hypothetical protein